MDLLLVEDAFISKYQLDRFMTERAGFVKAEQMSVDSLWVRRQALAHGDGRSPLHMPRHLWFPSYWEADWKRNLLYTGTATYKASLRVSGAFV